MFVHLGGHSLRWSRFHYNGLWTQMECVACWLCFRMPRLGAMNPAGCYHYCSQRLEVLWVSLRGLLGHPSWRQLYPMSLQTRGTIDKYGKLDGMQWKLVLQQLHKPLHTLSGQSWCLVVLQKTFTWDSPGNWAGTFALVQLVIPFILAFRSPAHATISRKRKKFSY
jgi:hypothetical protein